MSNGIVRPLAGAGMLVVVAAMLAVAIAMFAGVTTRSDTVTVQAPRAGLVMDKDAKVQMRGVTVGRVAAITYDQPGTATMELAIDPDQMKLIPANVGVRIAAPTVFGAKSVEFVQPSQPDSQHLQDGQFIATDDVSIEVNTVFSELTQVLSQIRPAELNAALSAISTGLSGRGEQFGQMIVDLNGYLGTVNTGLPAMRSLMHDMPDVLKVYADTAQPLLSTVKHANTVSETLVAEEHNLDAFLTSVIGLSNTGNRVLQQNRGALAKTLSVLVPTLALTDEYHEALTCALDGFADLAASPPADVPGLGLSASFLWGTEPYRNPDNLPKVAATGGPQCSMLPVGFQEKPPYVVADTGANPFDASRKSLELNVDSLRQALFGPIPDGAPR
ncbi:MCE family protein [Gordonia rhizosphera]|uniref:Mce family protein n=1 Tax=Gordonia rhizosphera NBRC 16068 TaxID=1108045 RepID=K6WSS6_9ACTN|nr:MCE family protein [Gordonia rhizosphera]GAB89614.1 Mce family protein [Gordonia rhizosphera NBRC 16068]